MKLLITALVSSAATAAIFLKDKIFKKKRTKVVSTGAKRSRSCRVALLRYQVCPRCFHKIPSNWLSLFDNSLEWFRHDMLRPGFLVNLSRWSLASQWSSGRTNKQWRYVSHWLFYFSIIHYFFSIRLLARNKITKTIRLQATQLDKVVVATDDERIAKVCRWIELRFNLSKAFALTLSSLPESTGLR